MNSYVLPHLLKSPYIVQNFCNEMECLKKIVVSRNVAYLGAASSAGYLIAKDYGTVDGNTVICHLD
jgi:hypothetical protein